MNIDHLAGAGYGAIAILGFNDLSLGIVFALISCVSYVVVCFVVDRSKEEWW